MLPVFLFSKKKKLKAKTGNFLSYKKRLKTNKKYPGFIMLFTKRNSLYILLFDKLLDSDFKSRGSNNTVIPEAYKPLPLNSNNNLN
jgi:hypothetical protein